MTIDLMNLAPTLISKDLRGKIVFFYGEPKSGKTSTAVKFPKHLLLATEKGYNAINNVMAQPIDRWVDLKRVLRQLRDPELKGKFETVILDTVDIAWDLCEKYICQREGVDNIGDIGFGAGYAMLKREFDEVLRSIPLMDYGLVMISHSQDKQFTSEDGEDYQKIVPTLPKNAELIVNRMADIIGYSRTIEDDDGSNVVNLYTRGTPRFTAGSRWKHMVNYIPFTYEALVDAISDAIEKQEEEDGIKAQEGHTNVYKKPETISYADAQAQIDANISELIKDETNIPKIQNIVTEHLGRNRRIADATEEQLDMLILILDDVKELNNQQ